MKKIFYLLIDKYFLFLLFINYYFIAILKNLFNFRYLIIISGLLFGLIVNYSIILSSKDKIFSSIQDLPHKRIGIVFGARVFHNGEPSQILRDRLITTYYAYKLGKIQKIIVSGDNSTIKYNEPYNMKKYLVKLGIKEEDIYIDYAGFDTYDSVYRAKYIFGVKDAILFSQNYHLSRAIFIANTLGINAIGMCSDLNKYAGINYYSFREFFSRIKGFLDSKIWFAKPKFLGSEIEIK